MTLSYIFSTTNLLDPSKSPTFDAMENIELLTEGIEVIGDDFESPDLKKVIGDDFESPDLKITFDFNVLR